MLFFFRGGVNTGKMVEEMVGKMETLATTLHASMGAERDNEESFSFQPPRRVYDASFKLQVVRHALSLPEKARNKPIARMYPGLTPVCITAHITTLYHVLGSPCPL